MALRARRAAPAIVLLVVGLPAGLLLSLSLPVFQQLADDGGNWHAGIAQLSESRAVARIGSQASRERGGNVPLVMLLGEPRPAVAEAARRALSERLDRWRMLPAEKSARQVADLASELARTAPRLSPTGRRRAADLAVRLLCWPLKTPTAGSAGLVDDCEQVLLAAATGPQSSEPSSTPHPAAELPAEVLRWPTLPVRRVTTAAGQPHATLDAPETPARSSANSEMSAESETSAKTRNSPKRSRSSNTPRSIAPAEFFTREGESAEPDPRDGPPRLRR